MRTTFFAASLVLAALVPTTHVAAQSAQDKAIALDIGNQLKSSGQLRDYRIGVKYKDGIAALSGTVSNREQLQKAVRLTQQMNGVDQVVNNLTIANSGGGISKPTQLANRASYTSVDSDKERATRTSYQQQGPQQGPYAGQGPMGPQGPQQPMYRQGMNGPGMNPGMNGPMMNQPPMNRQAMNPNMGPYGAGPQRPMNGGRMQAQGRGNMPRPMGRPQVQQAAMAQQQQMQAMQAGCNCGPGGMGGGMGGGMDMGGMGGGMGGPPAAMGHVPGGQAGAVNYDNAQMPGYAWPSYASYPNYAAVTYPKQYSPSAWPYIGPFYPYPQVPLGWRKVALEWDDGWWFLDFSDCGANH
jgi:hypothetical protein